MKITVDKEGRAAINQLCDVALKAGGLQNLNGITNVLSSVIEELPGRPVRPLIHEKSNKDDEIVVLKNQNLSEVKPEDDADEGD